VVWRGFLVIKLKRHCEHLAELAPEEAANLGLVIRTTCLALTEVLGSAKVYVFSFGDGVRHVHFWALPRPPWMRAGMHRVLFNLDMRTTLTRMLGFKRWVITDEEVSHISDKLREAFIKLLENGRYP
jgi:diadenosine tetraphosphate (Ap4A) HIT family hydrolase